MIYITSYAVNIFGIDKCLKKTPFYFALAPGGTGTKYCGFQIALTPAYKILVHPLSHYAGSLFLDLDTLHHSWIGSVVSFLADYSYSGFLGMLFVYFLHFTGKRYYLSKGIIFGIFIWLFSFGGLRSLTVVKLQRVPPGDWITIFLLHLLFGLALGMASRILERYISHK